MAHVSIISSQSGEQIFEGAPRYIGAYLKPGYLEFQAIGSPTAISWHVGDYVVYPRTGKTYRLYRTPQIAEQGDTMRYGAAFLYENVQFFDDSKRLELCPFTDLVPGDNTVHFSTQNIVSFFGKPLNVAERVQACLENQYGAGTWEVRIVTTTDADLLELLDTEVEFSVSGASCQQALDKVYELWNGLGWIHTVENGVNVITIGASNVRTNANTTVPFAYGNGLVRVERSIANADEIGTRLFAYGSMKNMDATYYRGLDIYHADSVDIEHLMIPLSEWGLTDGHPDARKAFIEDAAAIDKLGLIPRTAYFDGTGDLPDIHPTIERMTIGEVYDAGGTGYIPNLSKWSRGQRIDEIVSAVNPTDHGTSAEQGQKYTEDISSHLAAITDTFINNDTVSWTIFSVNTNNPGRLTLNFGQEPQPITLTTAWTPQLDLKLAVYAGGKRVEAPLTIRQASSTAWQIILPESVVVSGAAAGLAEARIEGVITNTAGGQTTVEGSFSTNASTAVTGGVEYELPKTFTVTIPQIGFDIEKYAALGNGKTISMKTGMCAGRDFEIKSAKYVSSTDSWLLTLYRSSDEDLGIMFPNADYQIAAGDQYVLLDIAMPDMYVTVASNRLLEAAQRLLADISVEQPFYAPQIDAKVVYNESRLLRDGMWMDITQEGHQEYVMIDSITIDENGSSIPTYEISLREKKGLDWTENIGKSLSSRSSQSVAGRDSSDATGSVTSVGVEVPVGMWVEGSPITSKGTIRIALSEGYFIPQTEDFDGIKEAFQSLQSQLDSVASRNMFDELKATSFFSDVAAFSSAYAERYYLTDGVYFYVEKVNGIACVHLNAPFITDGDQILGDGTPGGGTPTGVSYLHELLDVNISNPTNGQILAYNSTLQKWINADAPEDSVQKVAGVSPDANGDIPVADLKTALGLGSAAYKDTSYFAAASHTHSINEVSGLDANLTTISGALQSLQAQIDSVASRDCFDELTATAVTADQAVASEMYAERYYLTDDVYFTAEIVDGVVCVKLNSPLITTGDQILGSGGPSGGGGGGDISYLYELTDVDDNLNAPASGTILQWYSNKWIGTAFTSIANGDLLTYASGKWTNVARTSVGIVTDATTSTHGLMSAADKTKLDGINTTYISNGQTAYENLSTVSAMIQSLQKQVDSVASRDMYEELGATAFYSGVAGIGSLIADSIELGGESLKSIPNSYLANHSISINGSAVNLGGSFSTASITAGTAGTSSATSGASISVPYVTMNAYGIVTAYGTHTHSVSLANLVGSSAVGSASLPVYYNGSALVACTGSSLFSAMSSGASTNLSVTVAGQTRTATLYATYDSASENISDKFGIVSGALQSLQKQIDSVASRSDISDFEATTEAKLDYVCDLMRSLQSQIDSVASRTADVSANGYFDVISVGRAIYGDVLITSGDQTLSDERRKTITREITLTAEQIASCRAVAFDWKDKPGSSFGSIAQDWQKILPESVNDVDDTLYHFYGQSAEVAVINLAREIVELKKIIKRLTS